MEMSFSFFTLLALAATAVGIVSGLVLLYFGFRYNSANVPLGVAQLSTGLHVWVNFSMISGLIIHWPFMFGLPNTFPLIFIPMYLLYVVFYTQRRSWRWFDAFHAIPLVIFVVDYRDIFLMPTADKVAGIRQVLDNMDLLTRFKESEKYFGPGFHWEFQTVMFGLYWIAMVVIFVRWLRSRPSFTPANKAWRNWMITFLAYQFFLWFFHFLNLFGVAVFSFQIVSSTSVALWMTITLVIFFFPSIMYGSKLTELEGVTLTEKINAKAPLSEVGKQKLQQAMHTMETQLEERMLFLTAGYGINDFSRDTGLPVYQISKTLTTLRSLGFVDYINQKRIQYCIQKLNQGEWKNYTLEAVAAECGFNDRNSFRQAFNKLTQESHHPYIAGV
jgi:AraC-like DNA-binding protein